MYSQTSMTVSPTVILSQSVIKCESDIGAMYPKECYESSCCFHYGMKVMKVILELSVRLTLGGREIAVLEPKIPKS